MRLTDPEAAQRFAASRVAHLSTVDNSGTPHLVPITFAASSSTIVIAIDHKPKRGNDLKRLRNIEANPAVCLLADHYDEDWTRLWWVRADGIATILRGDDMTEPIDRLVAKYPQYGEIRPAGPVISVEVHRWTGWAYHSQE